MSPDTTGSAETRGFNPLPKHRLWRDRILPRAVWPLYWIVWLLLLPAWLIGIPARRRMASRPTRLALESGRIGWTQVFFEELIGSARDFVGTENAVQQVIDRDRPYLAQFRANQRRDDPTHLVLDVRTPAQRWWNSLVQGYAVAWHVLAHGRTPVIVLTDAFYRRQRWQAACLSAYRGAVVTFAPRRVITPLFPHGRIIGPLPMPISSERLAWLEQVATEFDHDGTLVQFIGHVYPPRSDFLDAVAERLAVEGISLSVNGDKWGTSNEAYWRTLAAADVVVTTCMQGPERPFMDWIWEQQLVFRYNEALAAGAALVASQVEGSSTFFHPGTDFLEFTSVDEAVTAIVALVRDDDYRRTIAASGHQASTRIIANSVFWTSANEHLSIRMVPA